MKILILYEIKKREFQSIILLKRELEKRNHTVVLQHLLDAKNLLFFFSKPDLVLTTYFNSDKSINSFIYNNVGRGVPVLNLQWEQIYSDKHIENLLNEKDFYYINSQQICWGINRYEFLKKLGFQEENLHICGSLAFDFLKKEFLPLFKKREELENEFNLPKNLKANLFISSFSYFCGSYSQKAKENYEEMTGLELEPFSKITTLSFEEIALWLLKYVDINKDEYIIYRPHPTEINTKVIDILNHERIFVIPDYSLQQWAYIADECFSWYSTGIFEVAMLNKPFKILRPIDIPYEYDMNFFNKLKICRSFNDFICSASQKMEKDLLNYYYDTEGFTHIKIANVIDEINKKQNEKDYFKGYNYKFNFVAFFALLILKIYRKGNVISKIIAIFSKHIDEFLYDLKLNIMTNKINDNEIKDFVYLLEKNNIE